MIVTIDGPAGAGKSSVARSLARRLGFRYLDTGAMYRAVAYLALRDDVDLDDGASMGHLARDMDLRFDDASVYLGDVNVTDAIRTAEVTAAVGKAADLPEVRRQLIVKQQQIASEGDDIVTEGRDQGTLVFPHAQCKFFLTASEEERARRRMQEMKDAGREVSLQRVLREQQQRDEDDRNRKFGGLKQPDDAFEILTDGLSRQQVVDRLAEIVLQRQKS